MDFSYGLAAKKSLLHNRNSNKKSILYTLRLRKPILLSSRNRFYCWRMCEDVSSSWQALELRYGA